MSELPSTPTSAEPNYISPPDQHLAPPQRKQTNPLYLWRHNRWLFLAYLAGLVIVLLGISLVSLIIYTQLGNNLAVSDLKPDDQAQSGPTATHNSDDDSFFAKQPLTVLYYSFAQTSGSKNMFQSTPDDHENRVLDIGYPDKYQFATSPNGEWLIRWNNQTVERAAAASPQKFKSIYELNQSDHKITSVIWQADTETIAIASSQTANSANNEARSTQVTLLPLLTLQPVKVFDQAVKFELVLVKFPNANALYFVENHNGTKRNLTQFNPQTKQVDKQFPTLNQNDLLAQLQFSSDMQSAFSFNETQVIRYNLDNMEQSTVYTTNRDCEVGKPNENSIAYAAVAPSGDKLLVTENLTQCLSQPSRRSAEPTPIPPTQQTTIYSIKDQKTIVREFNLDLPQLSASSWSPAEDYVWLAIDTQKSLIASAKTLALSPIPTPDRNAITRERVFIIGWLQPVK